jgi:cytochrome c oxidase subunit 3
MEATLNDSKTIFEQGSKQEELASSVAMVVVLTTFSMLFATLLLGYAVYRLTSPAWPPMGFDRVSLTLPSISTFVILLSSFAFHSFYVSYTEAKQVKKGLAVLSCVLGVGFMLTQFMLWDSLGSIGVFASSGIFASLLYGVTWIHAAHVVCGLVLLFLSLPIAFNKNFNFRLKLRLRGIGQFWHFLGVVWVIVYIAMFVF